LTEYVHVLRHPTGTTLDLPVPADGKVFTSATMLVSGHSATLSQNTGGVHITVPDAWDSLNTVIKLAVDPVSIDTSPNPTLNASVTVSSNVGNEWDKSKAVDGIRSSGSGSMGWSSSNSLTTDHTEWIIVKLDSIVKLREVDLYPRTDGVNAGYGFPVNFTILISTDSAAWTTVAAKTGYALPGGTVQRFTFTAQNARYIKIQGTSLRPNPNDMNQYRMQFAEIEVLRARDAVPVALPACRGISASPARTIGAAIRVLDLRGRVVGIRPNEGTSGKSLLPAANGPGVFLIEQIVAGKKSLRKFAMTLR
jgi:hypothetical protein